MTIDPFDLPSEAPTIRDTHRGAAFRAQAGVPTRRVSRDRAAQLCKHHHVSVLPGEAGVLWRPPTGIELGAGATDIQLMHALAHAVTHRTFPSHGAEWASHMVQLTRLLVGEARGDALEEAFAKEGVHVGPANRIRRCTMIARGALREQGPGLLARFVLDDDPEDFICLLEGIEDDGSCWVSRPGEASRLVPAARMRYVAWES